MDAMPSHRILPGDRADLDSACLVFARVLVVLVWSPGLANFSTALHTTGLRGPRRASGCTYTTTRSMQQAWQTQIFWKIFCTGFGLSPPVSVSTTAAGMRKKKKYLPPFVIRRLLRNYRGGSLAGGEQNARIARARRGAPRQLQRLPGALCGTARS